MKNPPKHSKRFDPTLPPVDRPLGGVATIIDKRKSSPSKQAESRKTGSP